MTTANNKTHATKGKEKREKEKKHTTYNSEHKKRKA